MFKGILVRTDKTFEVVEFVTGVDSEHEKSLQKYVGGWIENVSPRGLPRPYCFVCNEEGKLINLPLNPHGTAFYNGTWDFDRIKFHTTMSDYIAGDIVIMKIGDTDDGPDFVGLSDNDIDYLIHIIVEVDKVLRV